jgi:D-alanyl-D-alanine carboxypeptidase/D-alanyl-D-alanine-endopeptidase (penicillin-binding protein 4)
MYDAADANQLRRAITHAAVLALWCCLTIRSPLAADEKLSPQIREVINAPRFQHAHWGILVADRGTGEVIYELNADKLFAPASTTKLYSVATALDALGKDYCFETPVYRRGTVDAQGNFEGDLILVASGDLTLGGRTTPKNEIEFTKGDHTYANPSGEATLTGGDPLAGLNQLAKQVAAAGIHRVRGQIVIDARLFDPANGTGSGPSQLTPILVNDNVIDIVVTPMTKGASAKVDWRPRSASLAVDAQVETIAAGGET